MNWYKIAQQGLLFYPWDEILIENVSLYPQPSLVDRNGVKYYKCNVCGENVAENDIAGFIDQKGYYKDQTKQFSYPFKSFDWKNTDKLVSELNKLYLTVKPIYDEFSSLKQQLAKYQYNTQEYHQIQEKIDHLDHGVILNVFNSSPELKEVSEMMLHANTQWSLNFLKNLLRGEVDFESFNYFMNIGEEAVNDILNLVTRYGKSFDVAVKKVICNDCFENIKKCVSCNEPIFNEEKSYPVTWDKEDRVCRNCIEKGYFDVCMECGKADYSDEMHYFENEGSYCEKCAKDKIMDYDGYYADQIEEMAQDNPKPFKKWFNGDDRIYIPFAAEYQKIGDMDERITQYLQQHGCDTSAIDYQDGYCSYKGRKFRIGKFLEKIKYDDMKTLQEKFKNNPGLKKAFENKINNIFTNMLNEFAQSPYRKLTKQSDKLIVISQNPHDIAKMSTGRNWTSCMNLDKDGDRKDEVFCEVKEGGLVAYLISKDDKEIENPYARILIRRYENKKGVSLAIPEGKVYGSAPSSFYNQVADWLESRQVKLPKGDYNIRGMDWTDKLEGVYTRASFMIANQIIKIQSEINKMKKSNWYGQIKEADMRKESVPLGWIDDVYKALDRELQKKHGMTLQQWMAQKNNTVTAQKIYESNTKTNWYSLIKYSANQLADQIYYMLMNADNEGISVPSYGGVSDPLSLKEAINIAINRVLKSTGQGYLSEQQMNIVRRIDPDFLTNDIQQPNIGEENVQRNTVENGQEFEEDAPQI